MTDVFYLDSRKLVGKALIEHAKRENINLYHCEDSNECLYIIKDLNPRIIVLNLASVILELEAIRTWASEHHLKILYCGTHSEIEQAQLLELADCITSPFTPDIVIKKIREFI